MVVLFDVIGVIVEVFLNSLDYFLMVQVIDGILMFLFFGIVEVNYLNGVILLVLDLIFVLIIMEFMLGGFLKGELKRQFEEFMVIECGFVCWIGDILIVELCCCLVMVVDVDMELDCIEIDLDLLMVI